MRITMDFYDFWSSILILHIFDFMRYVLTYFYETFILNYEINLSNKYLKKNQFF